MIELKKIEYETHMKNLRAELDDIGLLKAVEKRCDEIDEECKYMRYAQHRFIQELLSEIMTLVKMKGEADDE